MLIICYKVLLQLKFIMY